MIARHRTHKLLRSFARMLLSLLGGLLAAGVYLALIHLTNSLGGAA